MGRSPIFNDSNAILMEILLSALVSGLMLGLVLAIMALGLTIIFGVMDMVNFAHGEFLMIGMYAGLLTAQFTGADPLFGLPLAAASRLSPGGPLLLRAGQIPASRSHAGPASGHFWADAFFA